MLPMDEQLIQWLSVKIRICPVREYGAVFELVCVGTLNRDWITGTGASCLLLNELSPDDFQNICICFPTQLHIPGKDF